MSKFLRIIIGVVIIILLIFISMFLLGVNIEGEAILFVLFMLVSTVIGCSVGVLLVKTNEKKTGKNLHIILVYFILEYLVVYSGL